MNLADRMPQTSRYLTGFSFSSTTALVCTASFGVCPLSGQAQGTEVGRGPAGRPRGRRPSSCRGGLHGVRRASLPLPGQLPGSRELLSRMAGAAGGPEMFHPLLFFAARPRLPFIAFGQSKWLQVVFSPHQTLHSQDKAPM